MAAMCCRHPAHHHAGTVRWQRAVRRHPLWALLFPLIPLVAEAAMVMMAVLAAVMQGEEMKSAPAAVIVWPAVAVAEEGSQVAPSAAEQSTSVHQTPICEPS